MSISCGFLLSRLATKVKNTVNLTDVIDSLVDERGLDREKVVTIVCEGIAAAYGKKYPGVTFYVSFNKKTGNLDIASDKEVVANVLDEDFEISLRKAKIIDPNATLGITLQVPFEEPVGRIEILTAKQIIAGKIRDLEQLAVYEEYKDKQGSIISGTVHKRERSGYAVSVGEVLAILPFEHIIPQEVIRIGHPVRALLKEVTPVARGDYQLVLDRISGEFVQRLLEIEIPEVFEGLVEIQKVVRIPGYKTKIIVASNRKEIDPVGTCVGVGGARIKPILRELGQEKIDLIQATDSIEKLVRYSLKPAEIDRVEVMDGGKVTVWLAPDQRSYAIGKMGQNINLASKLVGLEIQLQDLAGPEQTITLDSAQEDESDYDHERTDE
ncbi:transcription termination factor NusA [Candidatus Dependentiae bacterium]|nr:transcription termination factor NusA [Candidatus Dependentiae bacterium]